MLFDRIILEYIGKQKSGAKKMLSEKTLSKRKRSNNDREFYENVGVFFSIGIVFLTNCTRTKSGTKAI